MMQTKARNRVVAIKASAWSHLHISSGEKIERWDYFFDDGKLWLLDQVKLAVAAAKDRCLMDEMTKAAGESHESLHSFLNQHQSLRQTLRKIGREVPDRILSQEARLAKIREIRLFAGSPECYIPGSSIKGAIRTAIISELINQGKIPLMQNTDQLKKELMQGFALNSRDNEFFKNLLVSDSAILPEKDFGVASVEIYARTEGRRNDRGRQQEKPATDTYCELLLWDSEFEFEIKLRTGALGRTDISVSSVKDLLEIVDRFNRKIWKKEKQMRSDPRRNSKAIIDFYAAEPKDCYLMRLGFGSGQPATSILLDYQEKYKGQDRNMRQGRVYSERFVRETGKDLRDRTPYPFTAKSAVASDGEEEEQMPLGWVTITKHGVKEDVN